MTTVVATEVRRARMLKPEAVLPLSMFSDLTDHIPQYLLQVFVNPKKYLQGPSATKKIGRKHFAIVGSGAAGLTSAYLLLNAGHKVGNILSLNRTPNDPLWR